MLDVVGDGLLDVVEVLGEGVLECWIVGKKFENYRVQRPSGKSAKFEWPTGKSAVLETDKSIFFGALIVP